MPTPAPRDAPAPPDVSGLADPAAVVDAFGRLLERNTAAEAAGLAHPSDAGGAIQLDLVGGGRMVVWPTAATVGDDELARQKTRVLEHLAPGVAHDLINQVGGIQSFLQVVVAFDERDRRLLDESAARALETMKALHDLVRIRRLGPTPVAPSRLIDDALGLAAHALAEVSVTVDVPGDLPLVLADPADLRQAVLAVIVNALDALGWPVARGELRMSARHAARAVEIVVEDDAAAIPASALAGLFDPRPPADAGRSPLDLAVARHLLRGAGGDLRAEIGEGRGNRFVLELPVAPAVDAVGPAAGMDLDAGDATVPNADRPDTTAQVLVCDDDDSIRSLIVRVLRHDGLEAIGAATGEAALSLLAEQRIGLVIADHHLGTTSGLDLYRRAVELRPALRGRFILVSGDAGDAGLVAFADEHALPVVEKPFDVTDIARLARELTTS